MTEAYVVDENLVLDPSSTANYASQLSPAFRKSFDIGAICNNASLTRNEDGTFVGQSTDVAFLNVLDVVGLPDRRQVRGRLFCSL